jgi:rubredoxin
MRKFKCETCGYVFDPNAGDPDNGIQGGTSFDAIPFD